MKKLTSFNGKAQNEHLSNTEYPHFSYLNLIEARDDYTNELLLHTEICFPNDQYLSVDYHGLKPITQYFTEYTTRNDCRKRCYLTLIGKRKNDLISERKIFL